MRKRFICWTNDIKSNDYRLVNSNNNKIEFSKLHQFSISINSAYAIFESQLLAWTPEVENIYNDSYEFLQLAPIRFDNFGAKKVSKIFCNKQICHIITDEGALFSWGNDKDKTGLLGLGDVYYQTKPRINEYFKGKRIIDLSISEKHGAAIDITHQLYSWGSGEYGELGLSNVTKTNVPLLVSFLNKVLLKSVKCGPSYTIIIDYESTPYYYGLIHYENQLRKSTESLNSLKTINFDSSWSKIDHIYCGSQMIALIDIKGVVYLYSDKEGLNRIKIEMPIKSIKFIDATINALTTRCDYIYEFTCKKTDESLEEYIENLYSIDDNIKNLTFIDTPYYDKVLFFNLECNETIKEMIETKQERIFHLMKQRNCTASSSLSKYDNNFNHSHSNSNFLSSDNTNNNNFTLTKQTLINKTNHFHTGLSLNMNYNNDNDNCNTNLNIRNSVNSNCNSTSNSKRINRISSLLGHIFNTKIDHILTQSNSSSKFFFIGKKKIEIEKLYSSPVLEINDNANAKEEYIVTETISQRTHKKASSYTSRDVEMTNDSSSKRMRHMRASSQDKCIHSKHLNKILIKVNEEEDGCYESITNDENNNNKREEREDNEAIIETSKTGSILKKIMNKSNKNINEKNIKCKDNNTNSNGNSINDTSNDIGNDRDTDEISNKEIKEVPININHNKINNKEVIKPKQEEKEDNVKENSNIEEDKNNKPKRRKIKLHNNNHTTKVDIGKLFEKNLKISIHTQYKANNQLNSDNKNNNQHSLNFSSGKRSYKRIKNKEDSKDLISQSNNQSQNHNTIEDNQLIINKEEEEEKDRDKIVKTLSFKDKPHLVYLYDDVISNKIQLSNKRHFSHITMINELFDKNKLLSESNSQNNKLLENILNNKEKQMDLLNKVVYKKVCLSDTQSFKKTKEDKVLLNKNKDDYDKEKEVIIEYYESINNQIYKKPISLIQRQLPQQTKLTLDQIDAFSIINPAKLITIDKPNPNQYLLSQIVMSNSIYPLDKNCLSNAQSQSIKNSRDDYELSEALFAVDDITNYNSSTKRQSQYEVSSPYFNNKQGNDMSLLVNSNKNNCNKYQIEHLDLPQYLNDEKPKTNNSQSRLSPQSKTQLSLQITSEIQNTISINKNLTELKDIKEFHIEDERNNNQIELNEKRNDKRREERRKLIKKNKSNSIMMNNINDNQSSHFQRSSSMIAIRPMTTKALSSTITFNNFNNRKLALVSSQDYNTNHYQHHHRHINQMTRNDKDYILIEDNDNENDHNNYAYNSVNGFIDKVNPGSRQFNSIKCIPNNNLSLGNTLDRNNKTAIKLLNIVVNKTNSNTHQCSSPNIIRQSKQKLKHNKSMKSGLIDKAKHLSKHKDKLQKMPKGQFRKQSSIMSQSTNHRFNQTNYSNTTTGQLNNTSEHKEDNEGLIKSKKKDENSHKQKRSHRRQNSQNIISSITPSLTQDKPQIVTFNTLNRNESATQIKCKPRKPQVLQLSIERLRRKYLGYLSNSYGKDQNQILNQLLSEDVSQFNHIQLNQVKEKINFSNEKTNEVIPDKININNLIRLEYDDKKSEGSVYEPLELEKSNRSSFISSQFDKSRKSLIGFSDIPLINQGQNTEKSAGISTKKYDSTQRLIIELISEGKDSHTSL